MDASKNRKISDEVTQHSTMAQSCHFKKWGRDNSFTSGEAASKGIEISP